MKKKVSRFLRIRQPKRTVSCKLIFFFFVRGFGGNNMGNGAGRFARARTRKSKKTLPYHHCRIWGIFMEPSARLQFCGAVFLNKKVAVFWGVGLRRHLNCVCESAQHNLAYAGGGKRRSTEIEHLTV